MKRSADHGYVDAITGLGTFYENGTGVDKDQAKANRYYLKGAEGGDSLAMRYLAINYAEGIGFARDPAEAERWFLKAIEAGDDESKGLLDKLKASPDSAPAAIA